MEGLDAGSITHKYAHQLSVPRLQILQQPLSQVFLCLIKCIIVILTKMFRITGQLPLQIALCLHSARHSENMLTPILLCRMKQLFHNIGLRGIVKEELFKYIHKFTKKFRLLSAST